MTLLLRVILNSITRRIKFNCEIVELANKPRRLHEVVTKQEEKLKDARHLIFCLENGCEVCFPDGGVKYESDTDTDDFDESDEQDFEF